MLSSWGFHTLDISVRNREFLFDGATVARTVDKRNHRLVPILFHPFFLFRLFQTPYFVLLRLPYPDYHLVPYLAFCFLPLLASLLLPVGRYISTGKFCQFAFLKSLNCLTNSNIGCRVNFETRHLYYLKCFWPEVPADNRLSP